MIRLTVCRSRHTDFMGFMHGNRGVCRTWTSQIPFFLGTWLLGVFLGPQRMRFARSDDTCRAVGFYACGFKGEPTC